MLTTRARHLLAKGDDLLVASIRETDPDERFHLSYLAALRGAGAVAELSGPTRRRTRNAWELLASSAPEFAAWSDYFAGHSATRVAVESGAGRRVADVDAERFRARVVAFLHDVEDFVDRVDAAHRDESTPTRVAQRVA